MDFTVQGLLNAAMGALIPFLIAEVEFIKTLNPRALILLSGVIGTGIAIGINQLLFSFGMIAAVLPMQQLVLMGFAINQTAGELSYRTWVKKKPVIEEVK